MNGNKILQRDAGLDIIRSLAIAFVVCGHFFLHSAFNKTIFSGIDMFALGMGQTLFLTNVCLFMMLTGYLNINKQISKAYYKGGLRVLVSYFLLSVLTIFFRKYYLNDEYSLGQWLMKITDFSAIPYAWYIEMWIGLFLLTPFLNILWKGIASKSNKQLLIATLFIMTALPDFTNRYGLYLMPGYWYSAAYPLIYFFLGCYTKEYQPTISKWYLGVGIIALCLLNPLFNFCFIHQHTMLHVVGGPGGIVVIPLTTGIFLMFYQMKIQSERVKRMLKSISILSLDMYLVSYVFDALYYPLFLKNGIICQTHFVLLFIIIVPLVLSSSYIVAYTKSLFIK